MPLVAQCRVGDITSAVAFAADIIPNRTTIPILANVLLTAAGNTLSITATDLDQRAISHAAAQVTSDDSITVDASKFRNWLRCHDDRAEVALVTTKHGLFARIGDQSSLLLPTLPADDFPRPFDVSATDGCRLTEAEHCRLFRETVSIIPANEARFQLCGLYLRCTDHKLIAVASEGRRIVEASIDAPTDLAEFSVIVPRDFVLAAAKMKGDLILRVGEKHVEIESGNHTLTSKLIDGVYLDYQRAIPPLSDNTVEVDRSALIGSLELLRAAVGRPAQTTKADLPFASITWNDGADEVLLAAGDPEIGETVIPAIARGNAHVSVPIGQFVGLLNGIAAERVALNSATSTFAIRIAKVGADDFLALQSKVRP
jgi:DNA polymerase-3 subunit beta